MLSFIKNIGIFIICAQCLMHFTAGKEYEKYVKLLIGFMILAQFVIPIRSVFLGKDKAELWGSIEQFQQEMEAAVGEHNITYDMEQQVSQTLMEEIKAKLSAPAAEAGYQVESAAIQGEEGRERLVIVLRKVAVSEEGADQQTEETGVIEPVKIGIEKKYIVIDKKETLEKAETEGEMKKEEEEALKTEFALKLGVDQDYLRLRFR